MMWWNDGMSWGCWAAMSVAMVVFWALVVYALIAAFGRKGEGEPRVESPNQEPLDILRERFARGEIDADEYHARQETLRPLNPPR